MSPARTGDRRHRAAAGNELRSQQNHAIGIESRIVSSEVAHELAEQTKGPPQDRQEIGMGQGERKRLGRVLPARFADRTPKQNSVDAKRTGRERAEDAEE